LKVQFMQPEKTKTKPNQTKPSHSPVIYGCGCFRFQW
jgi:hypothetical protein